MKRTKAPLETNPMFQSNLFLDFLGPGVSPGIPLSGNSGELAKALQSLQLLHSTSTPHVPQTNGVVENSIRRVKEGTACLLLQAGLSHEWWSEAMRCYCCTRDTHDIMAYGSTPSPGCPLV